MSFDCMNCPHYSGGELQSNPGSAFTKPNGWSATVRRAAAADGS